MRGLHVAVHASLAVVASANANSAISRMGRILSFGAFAQQHARSGLPELVFVWINRGFFILFGIQHVFVFGMQEGLSHMFKCPRSGGEGSTSWSRRRGDGVCNIYMYTSLTDFLLSTTVEDEEVGGAAEVALDGVLGGSRSQGVVDLLRGLELGVATHGQGCDTDNVRGGHRGTRDGVAGSLAANPGRGDADTGAKDLDTLAERGEGSNVVTNVRGTDSEDVGSARGRTRAGVDVGIVTGSNNHGDVGLEQAGGGVVQSTGRATTQGHVDHSALALVDRDDPVQSSNNARGRAAAISCQDFNTNQLDLLGDSIGVATNGTSNVGAVTVLVSVGGALDKVGTHLGTAAKVSVSSVDTSVNDVGSDASAGRVGVLVRGLGVGQSATLADTAKTPGWRRFLGGLDGDNGVLLNVGDLVHGQELGDGGTGAGNSETGDGAEALVDSGAATTTGVLDTGGDFVELGGEGVGGVGILEDDDVGSRNGSRASGVADEGGGSVGRGRGPGQAGDNEERDVLHIVDCRLVVVFFLKERVVPGDNFVRIENCACSKLCGG